MLQGQSELSGQPLSMADEGDEVYLDYGDDGGGGTVEDLLGEEGYADDAYAADYEDANAEQAAVENGRAESAALPEEQETQASQPAEAPGSASKRSVPAAYFEDVGAQSSHQGQGRAGPGPGSMHTNANFQQGSHFSADSRGGRHPNGEQFGQGRGRGMTGQGVNARFGYGQHMQPFVEGPNGPNGGRGRGMMGGRHSPGPMGMGHQPGHVQGRMGGMMPSAGGMQNAGMMGGMHGVPMRPAIGRMGPGAPGPHDVAMRQQQALMQQMMSGAPPNMLASLAMLQGMDPMQIQAMARQLGLPIPNMRPINPATAHAGLATAQGGPGSVPLTPRMGPAPMHAMPGAMRPPPAILKPVPPGMAQTQLQPAVDMPSILPAGFHPDHSASASMPQGSHPSSIGPPQLLVLHPQQPVLGSRPLLAQPENMQGLGTSLQAMGQTLQHQHQQGMGGPGAAFLGMPPLMASQGAMPGFGAGSGSAEQSAGMQASLHRASSQQGLHNPAGQQMHQQHHHYQQQQQHVHQHQQQHQRQHPLLQGAAGGDNPPINQAQLSLQGLQSFNTGAPVDAQTISLAMANLKAVAEAAARAAGPAAPVPQVFYADEDEDEDEEPAPHVVQHAQHTHQAQHAQRSVQQTQHGGHGQQGQHQGQWPQQRHQKDGGGTHSTDANVACHAIEAGIFDANPAHAHSRTQNGHPTSFGQARSGSGPLAPAQAEGQGTAGEHPGSASMGPTGPAGARVQRPAGQRTGPGGRGPYGPTAGGPPGHPAAVYPAAGHPAAAYSRPVSNKWVRPELAAQKSTAAVAEGGADEVAGSSSVSARGVLDADGTAATAPGLGTGAVASMLRARSGSVDRSTPTAAASSSAVDAATAEAVTAAAARSAPAGRRPAAAASGAAPGNSGGGSPDEAQALLLKIAEMKEAIDRMAKAKAKGAVKARAPGQPSTAAKPAGQAVGTKRPAPLRAPSPAPATVTASTPAGGSGVEAAAAAGALAAAPAAKKPRPREATGPAPAAGPAATNIRTAPSESAIDSGSAGRPAQVMNGAIDALLTVGNEAASAGASAAAGRSLPFAAGTGAAAAGADAEACMEAPVDQFEFNFEEDDGGQLFDEPPAGGLESSSGTIAANGAMGQPFLRNTPAVLHAAAAATGTAGMAVCQADDDIALDETVGVLTAGGLVPTVVRGTMLLEDAHQAGMDGSQHAWSEQAEQEDAGQHPEGISYEQESVHEHGYDEGNVAGNGYAREFEALEDHDQGMHVGEEEDAENAEAAEQ